MRSSSTWRRPATVLRAACLVAPLAFLGIATGLGVTAGPAAAQSGPCGDRPCGTLPAGATPCGNQPCPTLPPGATACGNRPCGTLPKGASPCGNKPCATLPEGVTPCGDRQCPAAGPAGADARSPSPSPPSTPAPAGKGTATGSTGAVAPSTGGDGQSAPFHPLNTSASGWRWALPVLLAAAVGLVLLWLVRRRAKGRVRPGGGRGGP